MAIDLRDAIQSLMSEKRISEELVLSTIENILRAAYKKKFGTEENCIVKFTEDHSSVELLSRKTIVDEDNWYSEVTEIPIEQAMELAPGCEIGDELEIPVDISGFNRLCVQTAKQKARSDIREITKDTLYQEYKTREGQLIIGYYRRQLQNGDIMIDIGTTEGILPKRNQSPRESYEPNDKIKCYVDIVEKAERGVRVILSRTSPELIKKLFELEIPEIQQNQIEIVKVVREAGYRSKVAVVSRSEDIDPVGACVGLKGNRIQTIMSEIEGEKIDILRYDTNPVTYIRNALSPAQVQDVVIIDKNIYQAVAIVDESQLSLAIGKQGLNVRLANKLCDWMIDVKTMAQFQEMDIATEARNKAEAIFGSEQPEEGESAAGMEEERKSVDNGVPEDEIDLRELPFDPSMLEKLHFHDIYSVEDFLALDDDDFKAMADLSAEDIAEVRKVIDENVDIIEDESAEETQYICPNCGQPVTVGMTVCPHCGSGLSFEVEE